MPAPPLTITHLKTSKQYEGNGLINRYWFQWAKRTNLSNLVVRFDLLNEAGKVFTTASIKTPKVKVTGYVPSADGEPQQPIYDSTVFIKIDDVAREGPDQQATQFRYYVLTGVLTKSESVTAPMVGIAEDISIHG